MERRPLRLGGGARLPIDPVGDELLGDDPKTLREQLRLRLSVLSPEDSPGISFRKDVRQHGLKDGVLLDGELELRRSLRGLTNNPRPSVQRFDGGRTTHPKPHAVVTAVRREEMEAGGGAAVPRFANPGPAAHHAGTLSPTFPSGTVARGTFVALVRSVLAPFPDIAMHVVQAEGVGRERAHRHGLFSVFTLGGAVVGVVTIEVGLVRG